MIYFRLNDKIKEIKDFAENGLQGLMNSGIASLNTLVKLKKGYPMFVGGAPYSGKTEVVFEIAVNMAKQYKWKTFIYCGEGGNIEHIFFELMFKYLRKPYNYCSEAEKVSAEYFIHEHFVVCDHDSDYTIDSYYALVQQAEDECKIKFDVTIFDPFNDLDEEDEVYKGHIAKFTASALKKARKSSKKHNRVDILVTHVAEVPTEKDKESGKRFQPPAGPDEWANGRAWWRRGFLMLLVYRPPTFLKDDNGRPYEENETILWVQKAKPKGTGKTGKVSIFWEWKQNIFYSFDEVGQKLYSCEVNANAIPIPKLEPARDFLEPQNSKNDIEEMPF